MRCESKGLHGGRGVARTRVNPRKMYAVEDVIAVKYMYRRLVWLVKWKGYPHATWIPTRNFAPRSYWRQKMEELKNALSKGGSTRASSFESAPSRSGEGRPGGLNVKDVLDFKEKADGRQYCEVELDGVAGPVWMDVQDLGTCEPGIMRKVGKLKEAYESRHHKDDDDDATTASVTISDSECTHASVHKRDARKPTDIVAFRNKGGVEEWLVRWGNEYQRWESRQFVEKYGSQFNKKMDKLKYEEETYTVEDVLDFKVSRTGEEQFRVKWVGYAESTWEPTANLGDVTDQTLVDKMQRLRVRRGKSRKPGRSGKSRTPRKPDRTVKRSAGDLKTSRRPSGHKRDLQRSLRSA
ncbi:hypothetical protein CSUI_003250 [Cystoisospora suis]|uniref:Chromo domain-containing protein n=1 Tax=Cystoisospora suis TaxID=483139 RepID=A0A2C6L518_9APIC|nr:hypothetical protein CSUI_003250 [Cystoisospora suis]